MNNSHIKLDVNLTKMREKDIKFLNRKGHICRYCEFFYHGLCRSAEYIKDYARKKRRIDDMNIEILDCSLFKMAYYFKEKK